MNIKKRIGLAVAKFQPLHNGHVRLIFQMLQDCDTVIIALGSSQISGTIGYPYNVKQRIDFINTVFNSKKIKIIPIKDIGAADGKEWSSYVLKEIKKHGLPTPTDYYSGSKSDVSWFKDFELKDHSKNNYYDPNPVIGGTVPAFIIENKFDIQIENIKEMDITEKEKSLMISDVEEERYLDSIKLNLHILDRYTVSINMSGTDIRKSISNEYKEWIDFVPYCIKDKISEYFPKDLILSNILNKKREEDSKK